MAQIAPDSYTPGMIALRAGAVLAATALSVSLTAGAAGAIVPAKKGKQTVSGGRFVETLNPASERVLLLPVRLVMVPFSSHGHLRFRVREDDVLTRVESLDDGARDVVGSQ